MDDYPPARTVWTIGHSRHEFEDFAGLLALHRIELIVDVRTIPSSRMAPQFNQHAIRHSLRASGIDYVFMGLELGGRPDAEEMYDEKGRALYNKVAESNLFQGGIERLRKATLEHRVAVMCSEGKPDGCHRHLLVGRVLHALDIQVMNILTDGSAVSYTDMVGDDSTVALFEMEGGEPWKSVLSVRQESPQNNSFEH